MAAETLFERKVRERRERRAAEEEEQLRIEASRRAMELLDREERERQQRQRWAAFRTADGHVVGLEDFTNDDSLDESERARRYFVAAIEGLIGEVLASKVGTRNNTLNECAFRLGQISAGLSIPYKGAAGQLGRAAIKRGQTEIEVRSTLKSGITSGLKNPKGLPDDAA